MSLDVLAQVASETLKNEPKSPQKAKKKVNYVTNIVTVTNICKTHQIFNHTNF